MPSFNLLYRLLFLDKNKTQILITHFFEGTSEDLNIISPKRGSQCMCATTFGTKIKLVINAECKIWLSKAEDYVVCLMTSSVRVKFSTFFRSQSKTRINQRAAKQQSLRRTENFQQESKALKWWYVWSLVISAWGIRALDKSHVLKASLHRFGK